MVRRGKLLDTARRSPAGLKFRDLCSLAEAAGFVLDRQAGSHLIYRHATRADVPRLNLQEGKSGAAKPYQVQQVLDTLNLYGLEVKK